MVSKLDLQTYTSEFESHWAPLSYGLVPHLSKKSLVNYLSFTNFHDKGTTSEFLIKNKIQHKK